jgi:methylenetetrahydrofolate dehydrogenase (NADP+)/methenyltetrahydrofolate cyclohydrolase
MIDCQKYADEILDSITGSGHLAVISVGSDPASLSYIRGKKKDCERVGFAFTHLQFPENARWTDLAIAIGRLNKNDDVTGIIVQLPLPDHLDPDSICQLVAPDKDVDGFRDDSPFKPCTPEGIVYLLHKELGDLTGKSATIVGRGKLVGKPLMQMLLEENMTVTVCHSRSRNNDLQIHSNISNAIIVAIGKPNALRFPYATNNTIVIDCGVNRDENGKLCGDVAYADTYRITPVPRGVGLLTRAMLMKHVERKEA